MTPFLQHLITRHEPAALPSVRPRLPARFEANTGLAEPIMAPGHQETDASDGSFDPMSATRPSFLSTEQHLRPPSPVGQTGETDRPGFMQRQSPIAFGPAPIDPGTPVPWQPAGTPYFTPAVAVRGGSADTAPESGTDLRPLLQPYMDKGPDTTGNTERYNGAAQPETSPRTGDALLLLSPAYEAALQSMTEKWFRQKQSTGAIEHTATSRIRPRPAGIPPVPPAAEPAPTIKVTIGRIEVKRIPDRPASVPAEKTTTSRKPRLSLDEFLKTKKGQA